MGCNGGQVGSPWKWFTNTGVVTGGDYGTEGTCYNYTMEQCAHHVESTMPSCDDVKQVSPTCTKTCVDDKDRTYADDKHSADSSYAVNGVENIKAEIQQYGTVTSAFTVYEDFPTYKSGVYRHTTGK
jgi:cathepsin B